MKTKNPVGAPVSSKTTKIGSSATGYLLAKKRLVAELSLKDVGKALGVSLQFISNIERGRAPLPRIHAKKVSRLLGISMPELAKAMATDFVAGPFSQ